MAERAVAVFFYGSYINRDVLAEVEIDPDPFEVARLEGFDITIRPLANLVAAEEARVFGILTRATHAELARLYHHADHVLGERYLPEAVLVEAKAGPKPALCYIAHEMADAPADPAYVERIVGPAREYGFPAEYVAKLEGFRPAT
jgi:hypothetical protein